MTLEEAVDMMYEAALCALCHCDDNAQGMFPCNCTCEETTRRSESIEMLNKLRRDIIQELNKYNNETY